MVPNQFPTLSAPYRIGLIGEAPGESEVAENKPFVGMSGRFLRALLFKAGITADSCFIGNVCQHRPPNNDIKAFAWDGVEIQSGITQLTADLLEYKPHLIVLLGNTALHLFKPKESVDNWRGSLFEGWLGGIPFKCMATYHPAAVLRSYSWTPLLNFDLVRAANEGRFAELNLPKRIIDTDLPFDVLVTKLQDLRTHPRHIAIDIEGGVLEGVTCISFADSSTYCFVVPFYFGQWCPWTIEEEAMLLKEVALTLSDPNVPKILQNGLYDLFVLAYHMQIVVRGFTDDTMLMHWELMCEVEKGLQVQASLWTKEPYYKAERRTNDRQQFLTYNGKDSCVTYEIWQYLSSRLSGESYKHYRFNFELLLPLLYSELRGIRFDVEVSNKRLADIQAEVYAVQHELNVEAGVLLTIHSIFEMCRDRLCFVKDVKKGRVTSFAHITQHAKASCFGEAQRIITIITESAKTQRALTSSELGEISMLLECHLNVDSPPQMTDFLYRKLKLPVQFKKEHGKVTDKETTNKLALLKLIGKYDQIKAIPLLVKLRGLLTATETLGNKADPDGRIRCGYNIVGSETGRLSCYTSPSGSGFNLQTVTKKNRDIYKADEDHDFNQNDLAGADGWTVAAWCKTLGDPTMWNDYTSGLRPAKLIALMYLGHDLTKLTLPEIKTLSKQIIDGKATELNPHSWLYFACKRVQHGTNYMMGVNTQSDQILQDSFKLTGEAVFVPANPTCDNLKRLYLSRYPGILHWQRIAKSMLDKFGYCIVPSGHKRIFMGRRNDDSTLKEWLAHEPQANTTYATNRALWRLWYDRTNRRPDGSLWIENLHQVHDALITQWPTRIRLWAKGKIREWFHNPITVNGQEVIIPFEGTVSKHWPSGKDGEIIEMI